MRKRKIILGLMALVLGTTALASCDKNNKKSKASTESSVVETSNESVESKEATNESVESSKTSATTGMASSSNESVESSETNESVESSESSDEYSYNESQILELKQMASLLNPFEFDRCALQFHGERYIFNKVEGYWGLADDDSSLKEIEFIPVKKEALIEAAYPDIVGMMLDALTLENMCNTIYEYELNYKYTKLDDLHKVSVDLSYRTFDLYYDQLGDLFLATIKEDGMVYTLNCTLYSKTHANYYENLKNYEATAGVEADLTDLSTEYPCDVTDLVSNWYCYYEDACTFDSVTVVDEKPYSDGYLDCIVDTYLLTDMNPSNFIKITGATTYYMVENGEDGILLYDSNGYLFGNYYLSEGDEIITIFNNLDNITKNGIELSDLEFEVILEDISPVVNTNATTYINTAKDKDTRYYLEYDNNSWVIKDSIDSTDEFTKLVKILFSEYGDINTTIENLGSSQETYTVYRSQINGFDVTSLVLDKNNACYTFDDFGRLVKYSYLNSTIKIEYNTSPKVEIVR